MRVIKQVTIIGLGLIGGSLGMAIRRHRLAKTVVGLSRRPSTLRRAKRRGAIDVGTTDPRQAVQGADLVVLATPVDTIVPLGRTLARFMPPGCVLTDVGSTKAAIVQALERSLPHHVPFVGGHPIAGSEQWGIEAAETRLFEGTICILTPTMHTNRRALRRVMQLWKSLAGCVVTMSPRQHDRVLAATSHLPHLVASILALSVDASRLPCVPRSLLDMTRVAKSDPDLWDDIVLTNRASLTRAMDRFERQWRRMRRAIAQADAAMIRRLLARARVKRDAFRDG